ncbi:amine-terminal domain cyclin (macronuclear) [Tetrahymena thermophila SB210]|uniref:Amine-terminal domain cyclin n=1 Tax=Tetrahymena thermophila (strain SB210) TaxID=312017 RepID=Q237D1_TETTS|nr:amine-terminal domain cyclin [Tetrahymena thermophila SB210]EAR92319.3 amine-terminal domain cyclin [Tetrahymena thermophila SB210]|eukprot:XP_001012564.3 amine-terminal domain cyclin [Tetrahymena thermophila SB210]
MAAFSKLRGEKLIIIKQQLIFQPKTIFFVCVYLINIQNSACCFMKMNHHQNFEQFQFCSQLVWSVPSLFGIKVTEFLKHNLNEKRHEEYVKKSNINIPADLIAYIFQCSELLEVETIVHFHSIHLFHFYLERNPHELKSDLQLVCLVCLMLSSKLYEKCQICADNIIYISNYSYTKQDILKTENKILTSFNFQITLRDELLVDKVMIFLKLLDPLVASNTLEVFIKISIQLIEALYEDFLYIKNFPDMNLLSASIIQCASVLLTRHTGNMPIILRLSSLIKQNQLTVLQVSHQIFKKILKKEFMKGFSF